MSSTPKSAFYALTIDNFEDVVSFLTIKSVVLATGSNEFAFDIWFYIDGKSSEIVSQTNGLIMGVDNQSLFLSHPSTGKLFAGNQKIAAKQWTHVFVSYDNTHLTVALNGIDIYSKEIRNTKLLASGDLKIGAGFSGYMRTLRIYKKAVKPVDYKKYIYVQNYSTDMTELAGFISFTQHPMQDLSPNHLQIAITGTCYVVTCMHVYSPLGGYAALDNSPGINPGGFSSGKFSVHALVYPKRIIGNSTQAILSNGYINYNDTFALYLSFIDDNSAKIQVKLGGNLFTPDRSIPVQEWTDILVTFEGSTLSIYTGKDPVSQFPVPSYHRTRDGDVKIGNAFDTASTVSYSFEGYIASVALFDKALAQTDAGDFYDNPPFIFEDGIQALYSFDKGIAAELVTAANLTLTQDEGLLIAERTVDSLTETPYRFRVTKTYPPMSQIDEWRTQVISTAISSFYTNCFGLQFNFQSGSVENPPPYFKDYIYRHFRFNPICEALFAEEMTPDNSSGTHSASTHKKTPSQTINGLGFVLTRRHHVNTATAAYATPGGGAAAAPAAAAVTTSASAMQGSSLLFATILSSYAVTAITQIILNEVIKERKKRPVIPDDDPNKKYNVEILELTFQISPGDITKSSVYCQDSAGPVVPPEWKRNGTNNKYAVYIASKIQTVTLRAKIRLTVIKGIKKPSYHVTLSGYAPDGTKTFFNHVSGSGNFPEGEQVLELTATEKLTVPTDDIYKYDPLFMWNYKVDEDQDIHPDIALKYYTLPGIPAPPIYLDEARPDGYVYLEYLELLAKNPESPPAPANHPILILETQHIYNHTVLTYDSSNSQPAYLSFAMVQGHAAVIFRQRAFFEYMHSCQTQGTPVYANCIVYACVLQYCMYLLYMPWAEVKIITQLYTTDLTPPLLPPNQLLPVNTMLRASKHPNNFPAGTTFRYHAVVVVPENNTDLVYDGSIRYQDAVTTLHLAAIPYKLDNANPVTITMADAGSYLFYMFPVGTQCTCRTAFLLLSNQ